MVNWTETSVNYRADKVENKDCVVVIPAYKTKLNTFEHDSLVQCVKTLGNQYEIVLACPHSLDISSYYIIAGRALSVLRCNDSFFRSQKTYSDMCECWQFYDAFNDYQYMLIYQLDAWVFENRLKEFMDMGYDYLGALHLPGVHCVLGECGNGGFSLRRISRFIEVCKKTDFTSFKNYEDCAFTQQLKKEFNLPPMKICYRFSFQELPSRFYSMNGNKLPMGCHAAEKFGKTFWKQFIPCMNKTGILPQEQQEIPYKTINAINSVNGSVVKPKVIKREHVKKIK